MLADLSHSIAGRCNALFGPPQTVADDMHGNPREFVVHGRSAPVVARGAPLAQAGGLSNRFVAGPAQ